MQVASLQAQVQDQGDLSDLVVQDLIDASPLLLKAQFQASEDLEAHSQDSQEPLLILSVASAIVKALRVL